MERVSREVPYIRQCHGHGHVLGGAIKSARMQRSLAGSTSEPHAAVPGMALAGKLPMLGAPDG